MRKTLTICITLLLFSSCSPGSKEVMIIDSIESCKNCATYKYTVYIKDDGYSIYNYQHKIFTNERLNVGDTIKLTK